MNHLSLPVLFRAIPSSIDAKVFTAVKLDGAWRLNVIPPGGEGETRRPLSVRVPHDPVLDGIVANPDSILEYQAQIPAFWDATQYRSILRFDSVEGLAEVSVNGKSVGSHRGGFIPFEFDITPFLTSDQPNTLRVSVTHDPLTSHLSKAGQYASHRLTGINRHVSLFAVPREFAASRPRCATSIRSDHRVELSVAQEIEVVGVDSVEVAIRHELVDHTGETVATVSTRGPYRNNNVVSAVLELAEARLWSAEDPYLYTLYTSVQTEDASEVLETRVGCRSLAVSGSQVLVNGNPTKLRGVCRHDTHPQFGRAVPDGIMRTDAELFVDANINFVRTSHYPAAPGFLDACDELGLFVELELPICWMYGYGPDEMAPDFSSPSWDATPVEQQQHDREAMVRIAEEVVSYYSAWTCVVIWSLANESMWSPAFVAAGRRVTELDPTRPRVFNWAQYDEADADVCQVGADHYPGLAGIAKHEASRRPVLFDEFCHINCYNRWETGEDAGPREFWGDIFGRMWDGMYASSTIAGGSIWAGIDERFQVAGTEDYIGYGDWGIIDAWRRRKPEYWPVFKAYSPVQFVSLAYEKRSDQTIVLELEVENRFDATSFAHVRFVFTVDGETHVQTGHAAPRFRETLRLQLSHRPTGPVRVKAYSSTGRLLNDDAFNIEEHSVTATERSIPDGVRSDCAAFADTAFPIFLRRNPDPVFSKLEDYSQADFEPWTDFKIATSESEGDAANRKFTSESVNAHIGIDSTSGHFCEMSVGFDVTKGETEAIHAHAAGIRLLFPEPIVEISWERSALYGTYPDSHVGRPKGTARAKLPEAQPEHQWSAVGYGGEHADLTSTRSDIRMFRVRSETSEYIVRSSDGPLATRVRRSGDKWFLDVFTVWNGSSEWFLRGHTGDRLRAGKDLVRGRFTVTVRSIT
jgi:hypothetical protein